MNIRPGIYWKMENIEGEEVGVQFDLFCAAAGREKLNPMKALWASIEMTCGVIIAKRKTQAGVLKRMRAGLYEFQIQGPKNKRIRKVFKAVDDLDAHRIADEYAEIINSGVRAEMKPISLLDKGPEGYISIEIVDTSGRYVKRLPSYVCDMLFKCMDQSGAKVRTLEQFMRYAVRYYVKESVRKHGAFSYLPRVVVGPDSYVLRSDS